MAALIDHLGGQHRLLVERLGVRRVALVAGWSMAGCQSYQWAAQYPELVDAILQGVYPAGTRLPSSRKLAEQLGIARNTVVLAYQALADEGFLESRERVGFFVNPEVLGDHAPPDLTSDPSVAPAAANWNAVDWQRRLRVRPTELNMRSSLRLKR